MSDDVKSSKHVGQPIVAEQAFLKIAREWQDATMTAASDNALPTKADTMSLACLILSDEWGKQFTEGVDPQIKENERLAFSRWNGAPFAKYESLIWRLAGAISGKAPQSEIMTELIDTLTIHNSAIREWAMKLAWIVRHLMPAGVVVPLLLLDVENTLGAVREAMGLASALCQTNDELENFIAKYEPETYAEQSDSRIKQFRGEGFGLSQFTFLSMESDCRRMIEESILGCALSIP
jgi:hypothetical protein